MGVFPCQIEGFCVDVNPSQLNILQLGIIQKQQIIHQPAGDGGQTRMGLYKATKLLLKFRKSFPDQHEQRSVEQPGFQGVRERLLRYMPDNDGSPIAIESLVMKQKTAQLELSKRLQQVQSLLQRQPQMFALFQTGLYLLNPLSCGFRIGDFTGGMMCERGGRRHGVSTSQCPAHCLEACFYVAIVQNTSFFQYTQDILDHGYVRANLKSFVQVFNDG